MKKVIVIICLSIIFSCKKETQKLQKPKFLIGNWVRVNDKSTQKTYEFWKTDFTGLGFTLQKNDTIFKEALAIISKNDSLFLEVSGVNKNPTLFAFTSQTDSSFVCKNPKNDFPNTITYYKDNLQLKAQVSNAEFNISFVFDKIKD